MQIRLTVALESRGGGQGSGNTRTPACEVLVTAPAGTVLAAVTGALASAAAAAGGGEAAGGESAQETVAVYAGTERLDPHRQMIGEPPLLDGAVISLHGPSAPAAVPAYGPATARLHVIAGPDAGGIHLLRGGNVRLGRSAESDVPLDDPDVSRTHCSVTVTDSGAVTVTDLQSTNGTWLDGVPVGTQPVHFRPGSTLTLGESAVRLEAADPAGRLPTIPARPDGNGRLRLADPAEADATEQPAPEPPQAQQPLAEAAFAPPPALVPPDGSTHGAGLARPAAEEPAEERTRARGLSAWARFFTGRTGEQADPDAAAASPAAAATHPATAGLPADERLPDPATLLLTALGPGPRLWEREPGHPDALTVRLGSAHAGAGLLGEPVPVGLRDTGALGLAGPRPRLAGLARAVLAQLAAMHGPSTLEIVLVSADDHRSAEARSDEWAWLGRLPHLRPAHGQDCRLLTAYDRDQATARTAELVRRLGEERRVASAPRGPYTVLVVDGDPGSPALRETVARLTREGPDAGIHVIALADAPPATPASPLADTVETACAASPAFRECGTLALLSGAVATAVRVVRRPPGVDGRQAADPATTAGAAVATVDAVSPAWAERFARALAPLREPEGTAARTGTADLPVVTLPRSARLLDELGLARATPAALLARWSEPDSVEPGRAHLVFGAGPRGPVEQELTAGRGHVLITGATGSGKSELLRSLAASLAAGERPDRLRLVLLDGDGDAQEGLQVCAELPHVAGHLAAGEPVRMREFAQALTSELKRRAELVGPGGTFEAYARATGTPTPRVVTPRASPESGPAASPLRAMFRTPAPAHAQAGADDPEPEASRGTLRLRPRGGAGTVPRPHNIGTEGACAGDEADARLPRLVLLVDDLDTLVDPALGNPGRPSAGSVVRALESVAREGARLGMHVVAATGRREPSVNSGAVHMAAAEVQAELTAAAPGGDPGEDEKLPGRGVLTAASEPSTAFQSGRVTGRIPRTATRRPTVVPLDWTRAGDPPTRRPVRELGNGPTDLALLASATVRAAQSLGLPGAVASGEAGAARSRSGQEGALDS